MAFTEREATAAGYGTAISGLATGVFGAMAAREQMKIKKIEIRMNRMFAKAQFNRQMTAHFQSQRDLEEQVTQLATNADKEYKTKLASTRVAQAQSGAAGKSATGVTNNLTRSALGIEQIIAGNFGKAKRAGVYQLEAIQESRSAAELGFAMQDIQIKSAMSVPAWMQGLAGGVDSAVDGMAVYQQLRPPSGGAVLEEGEF